MNASDAATPYLWLDPSRRTDNLIAVMGDSIYVGDLASEAMERAQLLHSQLRRSDGKGLAEVTQVLAMADGVKSIPLARVSTISGNERTLKATITCNKEGWTKYVTKQHSEGIDVRFADAGARDEFFEVIRNRPGSEWAYSRREFSRLRAALYPLACAALAVGITWLFHGMAGGEIEATSTRAKTQLVQQILRRLGPTGVLIGGAIVVLGMVIWLARWIADPPIMITLKRRKG